MSGGSLDYFYFKLEEIADWLLLEKEPLRIAMGKKLKQAAEALHDIEWVDSGDYAEGNEINAIKKFLEKGAL